MGKHAFPKSLTEQPAQALTLLQAYSARSAFHNHLVLEGKENWCHHLFRISPVCALRPYHLVQRSNEIAGQNLTAAEEIADFRQVRPHLVVLGAGASRAAFPDGELQGRQLPIMSDFTEIVPVAPILDKAGIDWRGKNFENLYSLLSEDSKYRAVQAELEQVVFDYFADLRLPDRPTLYDSLVLCLRQKDVIATFNWDPSLIQAYQRSRRVTDSLPTLLFLHGNVAHGYCERDRFQGLRGTCVPAALNLSSRITFYSR